jgi:hypothetical protein
MTSLVISSKADNIKLGDADKDVSKKQCKGWLHNYMKLQRQKNRKSLRTGFNIGNVKLYLEGF